MQFQKSLELQYSLCQQQEGFHERSLHTNIGRLNESVVVIKQLPSLSDIHLETTLPTLN